MFEVDLGAGGGEEAGEGRHAWGPAGGQCKKGRYWLVWVMQEDSVKRVDIGWFGSCWMAVKKASILVDLGHAGGQC